MYRTGMEECLGYIYVSRVRCWEKMNVSKQDDLRVFIYYLPTDTIFGHRDSYASNPT